MESLIHVFRDCPDTMALWKQLVPVNLWHQFRILPFDQWIRWNINSRGRNQQTTDWCCIYATACWWLWRRQNTFVFEGKKISNTSLQHSIMASVSSMNEAREKLRIKNCSVKKQNPTHQYWCPPPASWIKVNTDGAFSRSVPGVASGGVLRDENSKFIKGFIFNGNEGDCLTAELWGCLLGLRTAWDLGYRDVILEIDSAEAADLIHNSTNGAHEDRQLVEEIKSVIGRDWNVNIQLISRWINEAADYLAKMGLASMPGYHLVSHANIELQRILEHDIT
ncbi:hypothetical protein QN277_016798 [Acacia crassicarpa]|uniref:RNase H type-1 domain-containing protein n=1 Tax=Acacia crassicarpa TaxID=499986 RepID=A0AAE1TCM3_9FABA|nr:hypothetical protein QN277_016798 [Acacia crassicarpa]